MSNRCFGEQAHSCAGLEGCAPLPVVVAPASPPVAERAVGLLAAKWHDLTAAVGDGTDVLVDIGRLRPGTPAQRIAAGCDRCVVVARPRLDDLTVLFAGLDDLADSVRLCIVVRGTAGYPLAEITNAIASRRPDVLVAGVLADDPRAAATLDGTATMTPRRLDRSPLMRSVDTLRTALGAGFEEGVWA